MSNQRSAEVSILPLIVNMEAGCSVSCKLLLFVVPWYQLFSLLFFSFSLFALSCPIRPHCLLRFTPGHMRRLQYEMDRRAWEQSKESNFSTWDGILAFFSHCVCGIWVYSLKLQTIGFCWSASKQV